MAVEWVREEVKNGSKGEFSCAKDSECLGEKEKERKYKKIETRIATFSFKVQGGVNLSRLTYWGIENMLSSIPIVYLSLQSLFKKITAIVAILL